MGNPNIWLLVAIGFGVVCGTIYTLIQRRHKPKLKLWLISSAVYFIVGYGIYRLLSILLG